MTRCIEPQLAFQFQGQPRIRARFAGGEACTIDGISAGCSWAEGIVNVGAGLACPASGCDQTLYSTPGAKPYALQPGPNGWYYTSPNGSTVNEPDLWKELGLADLNLTFNGQLVSQLEMQWQMRYGNTRAAASPPFRPQAPPSPPATIQSSIAYSRSYGAFLACEYLRAVANPDQVGATFLINVAALKGALSGVPQIGVPAIAAAGAWDIGGAEVIRTQCGAEVFGQ